MGRASVTDHEEHIAAISGLDALRISKGIIEAFRNAAVDDGSKKAMHYAGEMAIALKVISGLIKAGENADVLIIKVPNS